MSGEPRTRLEITQGSGAGNQAVFGGQLVEQRQALEISRVELEVQGVSEVVLDDMTVAPPARPSP